jgi:hypothetical protein
MCHAKISCWYRCCCGFLVDRGNVWIWCTHASNGKQNTKSQEEKTQTMYEPRSFQWRLLWSSFLLGFGIVGEVVFFFQKTFVHCIVVYAANAFLCCRLLFLLLVEDGLLGEALFGTPTKYNNSTTKSSIHSHERDVILTTYLDHRRSPK